LSASFYFIFEDGRRNRRAERPTKKNEKRQKEKTIRRTRERVFVVCEWRERGKERKIVVTFCSTETTVEVDTYTRKNVFHCIHCKHAKLVRVVQRPIFEQQNRNLLGGDDEKSDPVEILRQCRIGRKSEV